ncbi:hypothetical protein TNCT_312041 [Trichonephila clavata]|uniref:Uncharacterized protein n=1 Tax=Trichonephila clavata TaxID=2740835 RepID=A0A8X6HEM4_TRICU|nr:hypothetical protein TNCT_312041 [Trichonephila clavata]
MQTLKILLDRTKASPNPPPNSIQEAWVSTQTNPPDKSAAKRRRHFSTCAFVNIRSPRRTNLILITSRTFMYLGDSFSVVRFPVSSRIKIPD